MSDLIEFPSPDEPEDIIFRAGKVSYRLGVDCSVTAPDKDGDEIERPIGWEVWPVATYTHLDRLTDMGVPEQGIYLRYLDYQSRQRYVLLSGAASKSGLKRRADELRRSGVRVATGSEWRLPYALGIWADLKLRPAMVVTSRQGWLPEEHGCVYVHGREVYGAPPDERWEVEPTPSATVRSQRAGSLAEWQDLVRLEASTPGLLAAVGVSLAGAIVGMLELPGFVVHYAGDSSIGKTTAAGLAASVWGYPDEAGASAYRADWLSTRNALELLAARSSGACIILDELGKFREGGEAFTEVVYQLAGGKGKTRMRPDGQARPSHHWRLTGFSTGEILMRDKAGATTTAGATARMLDIPVERGDLTTDADHARRLNRALLSQYGEAGAAWAKCLAERGREYVQRYHAELPDWLRVQPFAGGEEQRILDHLRVVQTALALADELGLLPIERDRRNAALDWLYAQAVSAREGGRTAREAQLSALLELAEAEPQHFPTGDRYGSASQSVWGVRVRTDGQWRLWTRESWLKRCDLTQQMGLQARSFLRWAVEQGHAEAADNARPPFGATQSNWKVFAM